MHLPAVGRSESALAEISRLMNIPEPEYRDDVDWDHPTETKEKIKEKRRQAKLAAGTAPRKGKEPKGTKSQK